MNTRYDLNMDVPPREALRLLYVSKSRFGGDWNSVPHTHSCTEVFYCVSGRGQFNVEGKLLDVMPDDMVIVNPRVQHTELGYQAYPLEYIVLGIEGIEILFDQKDHGYTMLKCSDMREDLLSLTKILLQEIDAQSDGFEMICPDLTEVLLVKIVRLTSVSLRVTPPPSKSKECAQPKDILMRIITKQSLLISWPRLHTSISTTCPTPLRKNMARPPSTTCLSAESLRQKRFFPAQITA